MICIKVKCVITHKLKNCQTTSIPSTVINTSMNLERNYIFDRLLEKVYFWAIYLNIKLPLCLFFCDLILYISDIEYIYYILYKEKYPMF